MQAIFQKARMARATRRSRVESGDVCPCGDTPLNCWAIVDESKGGGVHVPDSG